MHEHSFAFFGKIAVLFGAATNFIVAAIAAEVYVPITIALFGLVGALGSAQIMSSHKQKKSLEEIHVLVNSRLTASLHENARMSKVLEAIRETVGAKVVAEATAAEQEQTAQGAKAELLAQIEDDIPAVSVEQDDSST